MADIHFDKRKPFRFKQFNISDEHSAMKIGTDAVLLGAWADVSEKKNILDIGTGSGVIALMLAQRSDANITALDIHKGSVEDAKKNFRNSKWADRLKVVRSSFQEYSQVGSTKYDLIVSNPPFFTNSLKSPNQLKNISKHNDLLPYKELIEGIKKLLDKNGIFCFIVPANEENNITQLSAEKGFHVKRKLTVYPKPSKVASRIILEFTASKAEEVTNENLIIRNNDNSYTSDYKKLTKRFYIHLH